MSLSTARVPGRQFGDVSGSFVNEAQAKIQNALRTTEPWKLVVYTALATYGIIRLRDLYLASDKSIPVRLRSWLISYAKKLPSVQKEIQAKAAEQGAKLEHELLDKQVAVIPMPHSSLPTTGLTHDEVLQMAEKYTELETIDWRHEIGVSGAVYNCSPDLTNLIGTIYSRFAWSNPLHPDLFPSVRLMEAEIISMCCRMFNGDEDACGSVTTGGTESLFLACKAYRDRAKHVHGVTRPNMVVSDCVHAAFDKAAQIMNIHIRYAPTDKTTYEVDVRAMEKLIDSNTCMIAVSAPCFPHGIVDPVERVASIALKHNVPLHVDCCLGGFLLPFMRKAGYLDVTRFDFSVAGVTSISADTHKYGFAPKGTSVIMYRSHDYLHYQYSVSAQWSGGIYASPSMCGSRCGALIAACWAVMLYYGEDKYVDSTRRIIAFTRELADAIRQVPHVFLMGDPKVSVVAISSNDFNIYRLNDEMTTRGWRLSALQNPPGIHISCTYIHTLQADFVQRFVRDMRTSIDIIMQTPNEGNTSGSAGMYGMSNSVPDPSILNEFVWIYLDTLTRLKPPTPSPMLISSSANETVSNGDAAAKLAVA